MDVPYKLEELAQAKFFSWNDYCCTGEDNPSWTDWLEQMKDLVGKRVFKMNELKHRIAVVYGR